MPVNTDLLDSNEDVSVPVLETQLQQEQHSIGGFFRKLFKMDEKKKDKDKNPSNTIREADDSGLFCHLYIYNVMLVSYICMLHFVLVM